MKSERSDREIQIQIELGLIDHMPPPHEETAACPMSYHGDTWGVQMIRERAEGQGKVQWT